MNTLRKVLWIIITITYIILVVGLVAYMFDPYGDTTFARLSIGIAGFYGIFTHFAGYINIIILIVMFILDRKKHKPFVVSDIFLLLLSIGWILISGWIWFQALMSV